MLHIQTKPLRNSFAKRFRNYLAAAEPSADALLAAAAPPPPPLAGASKPGAFGFNRPAPGAPSSLAPPLPPLVPPSAAPPAAGCTTAASSSSPLLLKRVKSVFSGVAWSAGRPMTPSGKPLGSGVNSFCVPERRRQRMQQSQPSHKSRSRGIKSVETRQQ